MLKGCLLLLLKEEILKTMSAMDDKFVAKMTIVANKKKNMTMNMKKMRMKYISAAASLLRPYISEQNYWVLQHHEVVDIIGFLILSLEYS